MSDGIGASVVPFVIGDDGEEEAAPRNPAERLHLSEAMRMAEAIVFASAVGSSRPFIPFKQSSSGA